MCLHCLIIVPFVRVSFFEGYFCVSNQPIRKVHWIKKMLHNKHASISSHYLVKILLFGLECHWQNLFSEGNLRAYKFDFKLFGPNWIALVGWIKYEIQVYLPKRSKDVLTKIPDRISSLNCLKNVKKVW